MQTFVVRTPLELDRRTFYVFFTPNVSTQTHTPEFCVSVLNLLDNKLVVIFLCFWHNSTFFVFMRYCGALLAQWRNSAKPMLHIEAFIVKRGVAPGFLFTTNRSCRTPETEIFSTPYPQFRKFCRKKASREQSFDNSLRHYAICVAPNIASAMKRATSPTNLSFSVFRV